MDIFDGYYYKSVKKFMELSGIWPYLSDQRRKLSISIFYFVNFTLALPTYIELHHKFGKNFNVSVENFISLMFTIGCCIKYTIAFVSSKRLKALFEQVAKDWQEIREGNEKEILENNTEVGRILVIFFTVYITFAWIVYCNMPFIPRIVDVLFPLNESRPLLLPFFADYVFFDQSKHHTFSCIHLGIVYLSSLICFAGVDTTFVITVKHTCGLFGIVCYRLETLINSSEKEDMYLLNSKALLQEVRSLIILHKNSIRCTELLEDTFSTGFLVLNLMCIFGLALATVYVLLIIGDFLKIFRIITFLIGVVINLLFINWVGQMIIDSSEQIFVSSYYCNWYRSSNNVRKTIGILMVRSLYPCQLTAGKISILCLESFGALMKATVSYITVFLSVM